MSPYSFGVVLAMCVFLGAGCASTSSTPPATTASTTPDSPSVTTMEEPTPTEAASDLTVEEMANMQARITTNKGEIVVQFYPDTAPNTVENFLTLAKKAYYDGVIFHRVIAGFMIQGGDPTGTGRGGPGYQFADELEDDRTYTRGTLAMANSGADTNGSQFFIMHQDYPLPHNYSIFGYVTEGMDVVDAIAASPTDSNDRPLTNVVMERVVVEERK